MRWDDWTGRRPSWLDEIRDEAEPLTAKELERRRQRREALADIVQEYRGDRRERARVARSLAAL